MPRQPRFNLPGYPQHIIQRGNNRNNVFARPADYRFYLDKLKQACEKFSCRLHAYVLMTNHVHMLMTPEMECGISKAMQSLGGNYAQYFNWRYERTGTLWEGRYKASVIDTDRYLLTCHRYIEMNPVRAGMVDHPGDYRWSSYACNARGWVDPLVTSHDLYVQLGHSPATRLLAYQELFKNSISDKALVDIRSAANGDWVLGDERFRGKVEALIQRQAAPKARGGDRKSHDFRNHRINRVRDD